MLRVGKKKDEKDDPKKESPKAESKDQKPSGPPKKESKPSAGAPPMEAGAPPPDAGAPPPMDPAMMAGAPPPAEPTMGIEPGMGTHDKLDQAIVVYMTPDMGPFMCGNCAHFQQPNMCGVVGGDIDPQGLCNVYTPPEQAPMEPELDPMMAEEAPMEPPMDPGAPPPEEMV